MLIIMASLTSALLLGVRRSWEKGEKRKKLKAHNRSQISRIMEQSRVTYDKNPTCSRNHKAVRTFCVDPLLFTPIYKSEFIPQITQHSPSRQNIALARLVLECILSERE